ncbi:hypothetical protein Tco_1207668 [Tanacetum coccineum]
MFTDAAQLFSVDLHRSCNNGDMYDYETLNEQRKGKNGNKSFADTVEPNITDAENKLSLIPMSVEEGREVVIFEEELRTRRYNLVRMLGKFGSKEIVSRNGQKENDNRVNGKEDVGFRRMRNGNRNAAKMGNGGGQKEAQGNKVSKTRMEFRQNLNMGGGEGFDAEGDEDDCDTKEVTEEEDIGKQEVAPFVSNQVEATT